MYGTLDIKALDIIHPDRHIIAAAYLIGVKSISDILKGKINEATLETQKIGIKVGITTGEQVLEKK